MSWVLMWTRTVRQGRLQWTNRATVQEVLGYDSEGVDVRIEAGWNQRVAWSELSVIRR